MTALVPVPLPTERTTFFDPPPRLGELRREAPIRPLDYPDGHVGWLVTNHDFARTVLSDPRFSARSEWKRSPVARPGATPFYGVAALPGWLVDMDRPEHTRIRRLVAKEFTAHRARELEPWIKRTVAERLDVMARQGPPADLVEAYALPVPSLTICELLGVPYTERARFQRDSSTLFRLDASAEEAARAMEWLEDMLGWLIEHKRRSPAQDLLSRLATGGVLSTDEIVGLGVLLLTAGHETTASSMALGAFALMCHAEQLAVFRAEPRVAAGAVEELLRYLTIFQFGVPRTALEDVTIAGVTVRAGQVVTVSLPAANRDPARFDEPDRLDLRRRAAGHVAFGHGVHQCLGQNLARVQLRAGLQALFRRFPRLSPAVGLDEVPLAHDMGFYGVHRLPVTW